MNVTALAVGLASGLFFSSCLVGLWLRRRRRQLEVVIADFRKEADLQAEARQALADAALEMSGAQCTFVFIKADVIRSGLYEAAGYSTLPRLQEIEAKHPEWVCKRLLRRHLAYGRHEYRDNILAVSHRWEQPDAPDASSIHVRAVREHLQACPSIECVWYDYWCLSLCICSSSCRVATQLALALLLRRCMPQGEDKTPIEKVDFKRMLMNVNLLYLGSSVLILQELSYMSRFWCRGAACRSNRSLAPDSHLWPLFSTGPSSRHGVVCRRRATRDSALPQPSGAAAAWCPSIRPQRRWLLSLSACGRGGVWTRRSRRSRARM